MSPQPVAQGRSRDGRVEPPSWCYRDCDARGCRSRMPYGHASRTASGWGARATRSGGAARSRRAAFVVLSPTVMRRSAVAVCPMVMQSRTDSGWSTHREAWITQATRRGGVVRSPSRLRGAIADCDARECRRRMLYGHASRTASGWAPGLRGEEVWCGHVEPPSWCYRDCDARECRSRMSYGHAVADSLGLEYPSRSVGPRAMRRGGMVRSCRGAFVVLSATVMRGGAVAVCPMAMRRGQTRAGAPGLRDREVRRGHAEPPQSMSPQSVAQGRSRDGRVEAPSWCYRRL
jgi:hypothetical protein